MTAQFYLDVESESLEMARGMEDPKIKNVLTSFEIDPDDMRQRFLDQARLARSAYELEACKCERKFSGTSDEQTLVWNSECPTHGTESQWYKDRGLDNG